MAKKSTVPTFKEPARKVSIEESLNLSPKPLPDDKNVENFIGGAETQSAEPKSEPAVKPEPAVEDKSQFEAEVKTKTKSKTTDKSKSKNPGGRPALKDDEKKEGVMIYMRKELKKRIDEAARELEMSRNAFITNSIVKSLKKLKKDDLN